MGHIYIYTQMQFQCRLMLNITGWLLKLLHDPLMGCWSIPGRFYNMSTSCLHPFCLALWGASWPSMWNESNAGHFWQSTLLMWYVWSTDLYYVDHYNEFTLFSFSYSWYVMKTQFYVLWLLWIIFFLLHLILILILPPTRHRNAYGTQQ